MKKTNSINVYDRNGNVVLQFGDSDYSYEFSEELIENIADRVADKLKGNKVKLGNFAPIDSNRSITVGELNNLQPMLSHIAINTGDFDIEGGITIFHDHNNVTKITDKGAFKIEKIM